MNFNNIRNLLKQKKTKIVGTISSVEGLEKFSKRKKLPCDIVEIRLDKIGTSIDWVGYGKKFQEKLPVILTIRLKEEGGEWEGTDKDRLKFFETAGGIINIIDIELSSNITNKLCKINFIFLCSYHNFKMTPSFNTLLRIFSEAQEKGADIIKIATMINKPADIKILSKFLESVKNKMPVCVIGMGEKGRESRTLLAKQGSAFTYAYLDKPVAPGQIACTTPLT